MSDAAPAALKLSQLLALLQKIDLRLFSILKEKKECEAELAKAHTLAKERSSGVEQIKAALAGKQEELRRSDKLLRDEALKLDEREKQISSFGNYKVQQSAEREIGLARERLTADEEKTLLIMEAVDALEKQLQVGIKAMEKAKSDHHSLSKEMIEAMDAFEDRELRAAQERQEVVTKLQPAVLSQYERTRQKYPVDAVVPLRREGNVCSACFMQIQPQQVLQILMGVIIVRCSGCSRILRANSDERKGE